MTRLTHEYLKQLGNEIQMEYEVEDEHYIEMLETHLKSRTTLHDKVRLSLGKALGSILEQGDSVKTRQLVQRCLDLMNGKVE